MIFHVLSFVFFFLILVSGYYLLFNLIQKLTILQKIAAFYLFVSSDIILVMEIAGLFHVFNNLFSLILIQSIITGIIFFINKMLKVGIPLISFDRYKGAFHEIYTILRNNRTLSILALFIFFNCMLLMVCIIKFPQNITDNLYNHLSRIGYWIQQGSLKHYSGFNTVSMIYPYNNSLLMSLPIVFLKTDKFVGLVQFFAALAACLSIYGIARAEGQSKESSIFASLFLLTYCVVIYESITAQNDLLVAAFISISLFFLISSIQTKNEKLVFFSFLSLALAFGTNQYSILILPAYSLLLIYGLFSAWEFKTEKLITLLTCFFILVFCFGSYAYVQNFMNFGSLFGPRGHVASVTGLNNLISLPSRIETNTSRLFAQFISCDGLPPQLEYQCLAAKNIVLRPLLSPNIESTQFLFTPTPFELIKPNVYNAEMAWYGPLSWILIIPSLIYTIFIGIKKRIKILLLYLITPISFILFIQFTKSGWDPYQGRYMITPIVLLQSITAWIFSRKTIINKLVILLFSFIGIFVMIYSTLNNASLPLISKSMMVDVETWGKEHSIVIQKIAYKLRPFIKNDTDIWHKSRFEIITIGNQTLYEPVVMVEEYVSLNDSLGIVSDFTEIPDYIFRGIEVRRQLYRIIPDQIDSNYLKTDFVLLSPEYADYLPYNYSRLDSINDWVILKRLR